MKDRAGPTLRLHLYEWVLLQRAVRHMTRDEHCLLYGHLHPDWHRMRNDINGQLDVQWKKRRSGHHAVNWDRL